jgi:hypothetical protein
MMQKMQGSMGSPAPPNFYQKSGTPSQLDDASNPMKSRQESPKGGERQGAGNGFDTRPPYHQ